MAKVILKYVCNAIVGMCLGGIIDHFASTGYIFSIIGIVVGIVISIFIKSK